MAKDRDQLTPAEPADHDRLRPKRSAAREAVEPLDPSTGRGPASSHSDPPASTEVGGDEKGKYR